MTNCEIDMTKKPRNDILVVGVGNSLRGDDGVGLYLVRRLGEWFGGRLNCMEANDADILFAEQIAGYDELLVIDAMVLENGESFSVIKLEPTDTYVPSGFVSHIFEWGAVLALARDIYGKSPKASVLGVSTSNFEFSEALSPACETHADKAFQFLVRYCSG